MKFLEKHKQLITNMLLAFVLISIGFALGKHSISSSSSGITPSASSSGSSSNSSVGPDRGYITATAGKNLLKLYYMHATFRCVTCNSIESKAKELVQRDFAEALQSGKIEWEDVNFQKNEPLAKKFDVVASCVVVAQLVNGEIKKFQRLDEVWTLLDKPVEFEQYVLGAIKMAYNETNGVAQ